MRSLETSLADHSMVMLRGIADLRGLPLVTNVREEAAEQLAVLMAAPAATEKLLDSLSPEARAAWSDLLANDGQMKTPAFARRHGAIRPIGPGRLEREAVWREPVCAAEELWYSGLVFRAFADIGDGPVEYVYIPDDLRPPSLVPRPGRGHDTRRSLVPRMTPAGERPSLEGERQAGNELAVDACALLAALTADAPRVDKAVTLRAADRERVERPFLQSHEARTALLLALAHELGWVLPVDGRLVVQATSATAWLRRSAWEQVSELFAAWRAGTHWNELRQLPEFHPEGAWQNDPLLARQAVLVVLAGLDADKWYALDDLVAHIKDEDPDFQRPDGNYTGWYLRDVESGEYLSGFESWDAVEGRLLRFLVCGPLFWLGAVALAQDADIPLFRLTVAGAYWIQNAALPALMPPARLIVTQDFKVAAPLFAPLYDRFRLLRFTEPAPVPRTQDQPTWHHISRRSLADARSHGVEPDKIIQFLQRASGRPLPPRVEAGLTRWSQHGGAVRVSRGAVLRVDDAATLAALRSDPVVAPLLGELLSAQAVIVPDANIARLLQAVDELGYTVKVD